MSSLYAGAGRDDSESIRAIQRAVDLGVTFIDTAEVYGPYVNERLIGRAIANRRAEVVIATKFGVISHCKGGIRDLDSSPANVRAAVEGSLSRLGVDEIDLYYQHRVDPKVPIEETIGALAELIRDGKIRYIGLSEAGPETIRRANKEHSISALQSEYSLWTRDAEHDVLPVARELGIGFVAYSPLGRGFLTGCFRSLEDIEDDFRRTNPRFIAGNFERNLKFLDILEAISRETEATLAQIALAWVIGRGDDIVAIPGTKQVSRVNENAGAASLTLNQSQLARLEALPEPAGDRYSDMTPIGR
jgi:aryl-alcohol dehydrogenase-like predicted oxidoreductase